MKNKNKVKKNKKVDWNYSNQPCCHRCGSFDVEVLSAGEILCNNPMCLAVSIPKEDGSYKIKLWEVKK